MSARVIEHRRVDFPGNRTAIVMNWNDRMELVVLGANFGELSEAERKRTFAAAEEMMEC